ncbi:PREDICTED: uncharacterized protein LOC105153217 [Acromyrmex echinatior]|uniref:uncharacterized protein LOC105153217 n=1 Tax=Acromyrmex echinatior TaxID=103372 RepID=UPI000580F92F|nr:PREDICTED: uncharacterized protein LOC105153217 [Acromyrmex echinatior]
MTKVSKKSSRLKIISKYLKLYYEYSTINSFKYFADSQRPWFESLVFMVYISYYEFMTTPLVTSTETDDYKTTLLSFPAIAICSINRISRQSATELATNM